MSQILVRWKGDKVSKWEHSHFKKKPSTQKKGRGEQRTLKDTREEEKRRTNREQGKRDASEKEGGRVAFNGDQKFGDHDQSLIR